MKNIIIYFSKTGNTEKIAKALAQELKCQEYNLKNINPDEIDLSKVENVFLGSGIYGGDFDVSVKNYIKRLKGKQFNVGFFVTRGGFLKIYEKTIQKLNLEVKSMKNKISSNFFQCFGKSGIFHKKNPNPEDLNRAKEWARNLKYE